MHHGLLATEALRFRLDTLHSHLVDPDRFDLERAAHVAASRADPVIDGALRTIGWAWAEAGLALDDLTRSWDQPAVHALFAERPELLDALDDIVGQVCRRAPCT